MKITSRFTPRSQGVRASLTLGLVGLGWLLAAGAVSAVEKPAAAAKTTNAPAPAVVEVEIPKSTFLVDPKSGRDPFFPSRRVVGQSAASESAPQVARFPDGVTLQGISVSAGRRLIIINVQTFGEGEKGHLKLNGRRVPIRVDSIKENSAVLTINEITQELFLRGKL